MSIVIYRAREILTLDLNCPTANAVAVRDGRILHVGEFNEICEYLSDVNFEVEERFKDVVIVPGFIEAHGHTFGDGALGRLVWTGIDDRPSPDGSISKGCKSIQDVIDRLVERSGEFPEGTISGYGFDPSFHDGRALRREDLDRVSTSQGVAVMNASGHLAYANSRQMELSGVTSSTTDIGVMKDQDGNPTGEFHENAMDLIFDQVKVLSSDPEKSVRNGGELLRQVGVTTGSDMSLFAAGRAFETYAKVVREESFPVRITYSPNVEEMSRLLDEKTIFPLMLKLRDESNDRFTFGPIKWVSDGSIQGFTGKLKWPGYCGGEDHGQLLLDEATLVENLTPYHDAGFQLAVHANGDEAIDTVVNAFEKIFNASPRINHRHRLEHFQMASPAVMTKMATLGLCANIFSNHIYYWGDTHRRKTMGPDKARRMDAAASAIRAGVVISLHSDHPVTPVNPLFTMWCAVNRRTRSNFELGSAEKITPLQALTAMTLGSAYLMNRDDVLGSIEVGKFADFTVLAENPLSVDPMTIKDIKVIGTVVGGKPTSD